MAFSMSWSVAVRLNAMFSRSVRLNSVASWKTSATCRWSADLSYSGRGTPSYATVPDAGSSSPAST
jgi:hypothetical protein